LARYAALLEPRDLKQTIAASMVGRLPIGITGLAILQLVQAATDSFSKGGAAAACYVIGLAAVAPVLGRLIDRNGPGLALLACSVAFPAALLSLVAAVEARSNLVLILIFAVAAGATFPPITVCMRRRVGHRRGAVRGRLGMHRYAALSALAATTSLANRAACSGERARPARSTRVHCPHRHHPLLLDCFRPARDRNDGVCHGERQCRARRHPALADEHG